MKPRHKKRLPAVPWTLEDVDVWRRFRLHPVILWRYVHADRTDAEVMSRIGRDHHLRLEFDDGFAAWLLPNFTWATLGHVYPDDAM